MTINQRFSINEDRNAIDSINPSNSAKGYCHEGAPDDDRYLRNRVLMVRLGDLVDNLIINTNPKKRDFQGVEYQPFNEERFSVWRALLCAIEASHLETLDVGLSIQHKFVGELKREKLGWQAFTSLSLFVDDVERLLRDLYGEFHNEALDRVRNAVFTVVEEFTKYLRKDIWQEHQDAKNIDLVSGIGLPEGCGISGSDCRRAYRSAHNLALHARAVLANPTAFSKYTVEFAKELEQSESWLVHPTDDGTVLDEIPF